MSKKMVNQAVLLIFFLLLLGLIAFCAWDSKKIDCRKECEGVDESKGLFQGSWCLNSNPKQKVKFMKDKHRPNLWFDGCLFYQIDFAKRQVCQTLNPNNPLYTIAIAKLNDNGDDQNNSIDFISTDHPDKTIRFVNILVIQNV